MEENNNVRLDIEQLFDVEELERKEVPGSPIITSGPGQLVEPQKSKNVRGGHRPSPSSRLWPRMAPLSLSRRREFIASRVPSSRLGVPLALEMHLEIL